MLFKVFWSMFKPLDAFKTMYPRLFQIYIFLQSANISYSLNNIPMLY